MQATVVAAVPEEDGWRVTQVLLDEASAATAFERKETRERGTPASAGGALPGVRREVQLRWRWALTGGSTFPISEKSRRNPDLRFCPSRPGR